MTLSDIQQDLLARGKALYVNGVRRAIYQAPCGGGKTWCAAEQTRLCLEKGMATQDEPILHIVHRRRLVDQMIDTLGRFKITASPLMEGRNRWNALVLCASRDTLLAMLKAGAPLPRGRLLIWDEAHVAAKEVQEHYLKANPQAYWTGYTATPVRPNGDSMAPPWQGLACMAPTSTLIAAKRLCTVKVFNPDAIGRRRRKGEKVKPVGDPVAHWLKYAKDLPTVVFASTVADSLAVAERYNAAGITAEHIDASTPEDDREAVFERSRMGETKIICNCGVLVEGIDLPWLTCCQILRGCNSLVLWLQANGRIMRFWEGKEHGICLDHAGAAHEFGLPDSDFVWELADEKANERANKPPKDAKPRSCLKCGFVSVNKPACPECGHIFPRQKRASMLSEGGDGLLTEFTGQQEAAQQADKLDREWMRCCYVGRAKGWPMRQVLGMFKGKTNLLPWQAGLSYQLPRDRGGWDMPASIYLDMHGKRKTG